MAFVSQVYKLTRNWPSPYKFNLVDQFQRAALSIASNIAEGSGRTRRDFQHFLTIARGSCYECVAILTIAKKEGLVSAGSHAAIYDKLDHLARMLTALKLSVASRK